MTSPLTPCARGGMVKEGILFPSQEKGKRKVSKEARNSPRLFLDQALGLGFTSGAVAAVTREGSKESLFLPGLYPANLDSATRGGARAAPGGTPAQRQWKWELMGG